MKYKCGDGYLSIFIIRTAEEFGYTDEMDMKCDHRKRLIERIQLQSRGWPLKCDYRKGLVSGLFAFSNKLLKHAVMKNLLYILLA